MSSSKKRLPTMIAKFAIASVLVIPLGCTSIFAKKNETLPSPEKKAHLSPEISKDIAEEILKEVWTLVKEKHYDEKMNNVNWDFVYKEHYAMLGESSKQEELLQILNKMVKKLGQSHVAVLPPLNRIEVKARSMIEKQTSNSNALSDAERKQPGDVGLRLCLAEQRIRVLEVKTDSPAAEAGIKTGDTIVSINGVQLDPAQKTDISVNFIAQSMLLGRAGTDLNLEYTNSENKPLKVSLTRKPTGTKWFQLGVMPASAVCFEYKKLPDSIAYVRMSPCFTDQIMMFRNIIPDLSTQRGLIIDLRNNPGGLMLFPDAMGGWLSDKKIFFGKMKTRTTTLDLQSYPQKEAFKGPLALLIDGGTASVAEIFVAGLQDAGRATLFGECSSGACLPSIFIEINRGYRLQTICGDFTRNNGKAIEKIGVTPDYPVTIKTDDLLKGNDSVIEAAVKWILGEKTQVAYLRKYSLFP